jgi:beta-1,4-mannosyltransferase
MWSSEPGSKQKADTKAVPLRITCVPYTNDNNAYIGSMRRVFANFGLVSKFPRIGELMADLVRFRGQRFDVLVASWIDNKVVDRHGRPSVRGIAILLLQTLVYRIWARRIVFVRHNRYPHTTAPKYVPLISKLLDGYELLCSAVITHSGAELQGRRHYWPHPLYPIQAVGVDPLPAELDLAPGYFVVFGRIEAYKRIDELIEKFPSNRRLLVLGTPGDPAYIRKLQTLQRDHVKVVPRFVDEAQAQLIIRRARALVLSHADADMIVSGSFFYAMSLGVPVFAVRTPFVEWIAPRVGEQLLTSEADLENLCSRIARSTEATIDLPDADRIVEQLFGDRAMQQAFGVTLEALFGTKPTTTI